jgi:glutathione S-transferase
VDLYALVLCRWTRGFASRPAREFARLGPYLQRLLERTAVQRVFAREGLGAPLV